MLIAISWVGLEQKIFHSSRGSLGWKNPARDPLGPQLWRPCRVGEKVPFLEESKEFT